MKFAVESPGVVADRISFLLQEAAEYPEPFLQINADGIVFVYNDKETGYKYYRKICDLTKNNS